MDNMSYQVPLYRVHNCFAFNYLEYDTSLPGIVEGRIHPIQFSNCITRINVAARKHRDKNLFLIIMFSLGLAMIIAYPFVDTTYFLYIALVFVPLCLIEYIVFCLLKRKTLQLLGTAVEQENEIFQTNGMRLIWRQSKRQIIVEVVRRVSLSYENPVMIQTVQKRERSNSAISRPTLSPQEQEKQPLLSQNDTEIEVLIPSHSPHSFHSSHSSHSSLSCGSSNSFGSVVQIPVE